MNDGDGDRRPCAGKDKESAKTGPDQPIVSAGRKCPICGKAVQFRFRPFCSRRCAEIDLGRWFSGTYAIPAVESEDEQSDFAKPADDT